MYIIEGVAESQIWVILAFFSLAFVIGVGVPAQRKTVSTHIGLFIMALLLMVFGKIFAFTGMPIAADVLREGGIFLEGMVIISLLGVLLFTALLPMGRVHAPRILHDVTVAVVEIVWVMAMLQMHEVNVTGIIATSAVLTAVVGLAMQDTLGNIVSGLALQLDKSVNVGDWVKIDDITGRVIETRWRYTAVETRNWETVLIPNATLSRAKVIVQGRRTDQPVQWRRWVWFNLDFRYSPSQVITVVEEAIRMAEIPRVAAEPKPNCVAMDFSESYTRYALRYWLTDIAADDPTDSEVRTHIYSALARAGMALSIPAHAIFMTEENVQRKELKAQHALSDRMEALRAVKIFEKLPEAHVKRMAEQLVAAPFDRGDIMTRQGADPHWLYIVLDGAADRFVENEQHQSTKVGEIHAGDIFGEWSLMTGTKRESTVIATGKVNCWRLPRKAFLEAIGGSPELSEEIAHIVAQRRTQLESALQSLDETARQQRHVDNQSRVMQGIRRLLGV